jgi:peptidoglycan/LPS O-acetylase OafA/YrhL
VQVLILRLGHQPAGNINVLWLLAVSVAAVAASAALYTFIEHPVESWLRSMQKRRRAPEVVVRAPSPEAA